MKNPKVIAIKSISLLLVLALVLPVNVMAVESRASYYLDAYSAYVYPAGWGKVQVWFEVHGTNDMDEIGALQIQLYESKDNETWTWVKTYQHVDYSGMLGYNDFSHYGHVEYGGTIGRYYKAYVHIWAGPEDGGDGRYIWTPVERCI